MKFGSNGNGLLVSHLSVSKYHKIMKFIIVIMKYYDKKLKFNLLDVLYLTISLFHLNL